MEDIARSVQLIFFVRSKGSCPSRSNKLLWSCNKCIFDFHCPGQNNFIYQTALKECIQQELLTDAEIFDEIL